jgi:serine/threonine-protein kinase HipA
MKLNKCPGCLENGYESYCNKCAKKIFDGSKISHNLSFTRPEFNKIKIEDSGKMSISGIQIKHSLRIENGELILTERNGQYILKPIPSGHFENLEQVPANEHLTMQIASQVCNINVANNGIVFFADDEIAYITRRFDIKKDGKKFLQEDFAQVAGRTEETHGMHYKYDFSYEEIAELLKKYVNAYQIEVEKYFRIIIFNYLFSNGDSHLKNFSLIKNEEYGDYLLTPFYDLLNTSLHVPGESDTALDLFKDGFQTEAFKAGSKLTRPDFIEFAKRVGIKEIRFEKIYNDMISKSDIVNELISRSFLNDKMKVEYLQSYKSKLKRLKF